MTETRTVEIPADVKGNSTHTIRVQWGGTRDARPDEVESGKRFLDLFGYTLYEWDDIDQTGTRVTLHRFVNREGQTVDLFATYHFTRVKCTDCEHHWATSYLQVTDRDGNVHPAAPFCDYHGEAVKKTSERLRGQSIAESERLHIGQH